MAVRVLRLTMRQNAVRRGVKRHYNRRAEKFEIVTTRFTAEQYDILHAAAAAMRVSVSWLVYLMLLLWEKPVRRGQAPQYLTNYSLDCLKWNERVGVITESLYFYPKSTPPEAVETMLYRLT